MFKNISTQHRHNEDAETEARGSLDKTRANAQ